MKRELVRNVNEEHPKEIFNCFGHVQEVSIEYRPNTHLSKGIAILTMESEEDAKKCVDGMNKGFIDGVFVL